MSRRRWADKLDPVRRRLQRRVGQDPLRYADLSPAVDEYFAGRPILLARVDYTGRVAVKP